MADLGTLWYPMHADDSRRLAHWHYHMDPAAQRVLFVHPPAGIAGEQMLAFEPNLLIVVREASEPARLMSRDRFAMPHVIWEVSPATFEAVERGTVSKPSGFETGQWEEVPRPANGKPTLLTRLTLTNFRCFEAKEVLFQPGFNVLIGRNETGKTAVLDALAEIFRYVVRGLSGEESVMLLSRDDVRVIAFPRGDIAVEEPQYPANIGVAFSMFGDDLGGEYGWSVTSEHGSAWMGTGWPISFVNVLDFARLSVQSGYDVPLPLFAYYRTGRMWPGAGAPNGARYDERSRLAGYAGWDQPAVDMRPLEHWWNRMELLQAQRGASIGLFNAVRATVLRSLGDHDYDGVRYDADLQCLAARRKGGPWLPFRKLSDGVRNMFGMVADLAVRCARLNPHLGAQAPERTSGVVLIDELDLHLHPEWQRGIVEHLRRAFPLVQFITTTHSPLVLQSLHGGTVIGLDKPLADDPADKSVEDILEIVMDIERPQRSRRWHMMVDAAREYQRALEGAGRATAEEKEAIKKKLDELMEPYRDNPAYVAFLQLQRAASGLDGATVAA